MHYVKQKIILKLEIEKLDIAQSYFKGKLKLDEKNYILNLQAHSSEKIIKFPFTREKNQLVTIQISGPNGISVKDTLLFKGPSEWVEIDSTDMLHYVAANQDSFDTLEVYLETN